MVVDFDDYHETNDQLERLRELKRINPLFRCTVFAVPGLGSDEFWASTPRWIELAVHGWKHGGPDCSDAHECSEWSYFRMVSLLEEPAVKKHFVNGFKAPGWQISNDCYRVLLDRGWWVADQHLEDARRPQGLRTYLYEDGDRWHGHIQNVCGNGLEETWGELTERIATATSFRWCSEAAS